jgi:hypothetical protein
MIADLLSSTDSNRILAAPKRGPSFFCVYESHRRLGIANETSFDFRLLQQNLPKAEITNASRLKTSAHRATVG